VSFFAELFASLVNSIQPTAAAHSPQEHSEQCSQAWVLPIAVVAIATQSHKPLSTCWFSKLKERLIWRTEFETLDQARGEIQAYIDQYHNRPHSGLNYRTPNEVKNEWNNNQPLLKTPA